MPGSETPSDPPPTADELEERLRRGRAAAEAADDATAESEYLFVLAETRGTGGALEFRALAHLTSIYMQQDREMEALRLARRLTERAPARSPALRAWAAHSICAAFANVEDWTRVARDIPAFEAAIAACPPTDQEFYRRALLVLRGRLALHTGDLAGAAQFAADAVAASLSTSHVWTRLTALVLTAWSACRSGRFLEGLEAARRAHRLAPSPASALETVHVEALCALEVEGPEAAADVVRSAFDDIEARPRVSPAPAHLAHFGPALAQLAGQCGDVALARRVCDLAAAAMLGRLVELARDVSDLPELREGTPDDEAALTAFRGRFRENRTALLAGLAGLLRPAEGSAFLRSDDDSVRVCAWCVRSLQEDGSWQPFGHVAHSVAGVRVTHGICPSCAAAHPH